MKRALSHYQVKDLAFPMNDYVFPDGDGEFFGVLVMKKWAKRQGLICYFDTECGNQYKLMVWNHRNPEKKYSPKNGTTNMSDLPFGSEMKVSYTKNEKGKTQWNNVEVIYVPVSKKEIESDTGKKENEKH